MKKHIIVFANKWWEASVLVSVLEHARDIKPDFSASPIPFVTLSRHSPQQCGAWPRLSLDIAGILVEIICLEDYIPPERNSSSSFAKQEVLQSLTDKGKLRDAVIFAVGTAASPEPNVAGDVVVGSSVLVLSPYDDHSSNEIARFSNRTGEILLSEFGERLLEFIKKFEFEEAQKRLISPPNNPSSKPVIHAGSDFVSLGVINVVNNGDYKEVDFSAMKLFESRRTGCQIAKSIETTHGLIRLCIDEPFLYVSGITNQVGRFEEEVGRNKYSQNFAASHNAAITVAWLLPKVCEYLTQFKHETKE